MSLININDLTFSYDSGYETIFSHVSFQIDTNWKLGFTGRNGRGKTTFLNLLLGKLDCSGSISSSVAFEYFPYTIKHGKQGSLEIANDMLQDFEDWRLIKELDRLDLSEETLYRPFDTLSGGEQTKILLAILFLKENHFLLIDEPTNHLDRKAREVLGRYLNSKRGFILVSHDRALLDACTDHILSINKTNIEIQKGNFSSWWQNKMHSDQFEINRNEKLKQDIERLSAASERVSRWSDKTEKSKNGTRNSGLRPDKGYIGHKSAKMMQRSKSIENRYASAIEEKAGLLKNVETAEPLKLSPRIYPSDCLAEFKEVGLFYDGRPVCSGLDFQIRRGDRIALCGKNGSGKSSVLKRICGEPIESSGQIHIGAQLTISYIGQELSGASGSLSTYARRYGIEESLFKTILRKLDFSRIQFDGTIENFSAGQKKKVFLARSLCQQAHLYVWDEPLNYIDLLSRMQIEQLLVEYQPTLLFVEHDQSFCDAVATKYVYL